MKKKLKIAPAHPMGRCGMRVVNARVTRAENPDRPTTPAASAWIAAGIFCSSVLTTACDAVAPASSRTESAPPPQMIFHKNVRELTLTAKEGVVRFGSDTIEIKNGEIKINGRSHGKVHADAHVRYIVLDESKDLYIDEILRRPIADS